MTCFWKLFVFMFVLQINCEENEICFLVIGDIGGVPYYPYQTASQKKVASLLAKVSEKLKCKFVMGLGDNFYFNGVKNVDDPRFHQTFELTYAAKSLDFPWYMIAGNHDHAQNISAQIAYTKKSKKWFYPDYFYTKVFNIPNSNKTLQIIMIDTMMLCWHNRRSGAPSPEVQLNWFADELQKSTANFLIVGGHHPIYSAGSHGNSACLIEKVKPLLEKFKVTAYFSGHDHNLQHIKEDYSPTHYFVSGSGNFVDSRMLNKGKLPTNSLKFAHGLYGGFMLARVNEKWLELLMTNSVPEKLYKVLLLPRNPFFIEEFDYGAKQMIIKEPVLNEIAFHEIPNPIEAVNVKNENHESFSLKEKIFSSEWFYGGLYNIKKNENQSLS
ncbi:tartrate-resistant acid phosphatase type 5 isoform X1 [Hydra vulgaris]|uniref:tartrate-resistant acid phosphatase type 5 isoform X1 n=2 Tax=Hydra vulgaris TaxID=6087 RepID=UPI000640C0DB|nr:tartrate-resistant acid phosphatase type 5-like isoform X1 [Hydra vulgaris]XP_047143162.1 tartrate-resistant acid phosphatase type 5-like isoform X1 [Hydra vulgaris]XP_047143221.1 tartrate-resistant acid phosphatase type 5-like isoform X1 [Hydra vulgaris]